MRKNYRELLRLLPDGYTIGFPRVEGTMPGQRGRILGSHGHPYVLDPAGAPVRDARGVPFRVCCSPNNAGFQDDRRAVRKLAAELARRAEHVRA